MKKIKIIDWGDGHKVKVKLPDLSDLPKVTCPVDCYPVGEGDTGKVIKGNSK